MANLLRCEDCEHWHQHRNMPGIGRCVAIRPVNYSTDDGDPAAAIVASDHTTAYLVTAASWGCASWLAIDNDGPMDDDHYEDYLDQEERSFQGLDGG